MELDNWKERTELLLGKEKLELLKSSHVLVVGLGGVGGSAAEFLCRAGVGKMTLIDADIFSSSNLNRQIGALKSTLGKAKTEIFEQRLKDINPDIELKTIHEFLSNENIFEILSEQFDFVADAIDSLTPKINLIHYCIKSNIPFISSMGAGGRTDPTQIKIDDLSKSYNDGLARMLRKRLHKLGVYKGFKVVFSPETVNPESIKHIENERNKKTTLGTISYMPTLFGGYMAAYIIEQIISTKN